MSGGGVRSFWEALCTERQLNAGFPLLLQPAEPGWLPSPWSISVGVGVHLCVRGTALCCFLGVSRKIYLQKGFLRFRIKSYDLASGSFWLGAEGSQHSVGSSPYRKAAYLRSSTYMKIHLCHRVTFASPHIQLKKDAFCCSDAGESPLSPRPKREHREIKQDFNKCNTDVAMKTSATQVSVCFPCPERQNKPN